MWITFQQLVELGLSENTVYRRIKSGEFTARWVRGSTKGTAKGRHKEIKVDSLPPDLQIKILRQSESQSEHEPSIADNPDDRIQKLATALTRFSPPKYTIEQRQSIERRCIELASLCDEAISLISKLKSTTGVTIISHGSREAGLNRAYHPSLVRLATRTASTDLVYTSLYPSASKPLSVSTFLKLIKQYRKHGLSAFIRPPQTLSPAKDERFSDVPQEAIDWLRRSLKSYVKASVTTYGEKWLAWAKRSNIKLPFTDYRPGKPNSCYSWLYRWKKNVPAISMTLATEGERGIETRYAWIKRDYSDLRPREGFVMDWKTFDVECFLPAKKAGGKPMLTRLMVCTVFDLASRAVFGYYVDHKPSARGVTLAYLNAIGDAEWKSEPGFEMLRGMQRAPAGREPFALLDKCRDFRAYAVEGREVEIKAFDLESGLIQVLSTYKVGLAADLSFVVRHAKPFNAKAKPVEPFHHYAYGQWEKALPGFKGIKPHESPHYYKAARRIHDAFIRGRTPKNEDLRQLPPLWRDQYEANKKEYGYGTPFMDEVAFRAEFVKCIVGYNRKPHGALENARGEMSPLDYLNLNADTPHKLSELAMAALLMEPRTLMVRDGALNVQWGGERFLYREVASHLSDGTALYRLPASTTVEMRYDPASVGRALVLSLGAPLCWVEQPELLGWNASRDDFKRANADKKKAQQTAEEFFKTQQPSDWRDYAAERLPEALPMAVNAGEVFEEESGARSQEPESKPASITVPTRFDRRSPDAPLRPALVSPLRVVPDPQPERDEINLKIFDSSDDDMEIKAKWED